MSTVESAPPSISSMTAQQGAPLPEIITSEPLPAAPVKAPRLVSLDVFRGVTIAAMILVNNQPDPKYWPLEHVEWHGWTPTDLIFPFFLFIVGVATPFSLGKRAVGESRGSLLGHIWARAIALFALGEFLTGIPFTNMSTPPAGYGWITGLRIALASFCLLGVLLLLFPWKAKAKAWVLPLALLALFYVVAFVCHVVIKHATAGLPGDFNFGNGLLNPTRLRIPGVLQRIGICYGVAATIGLFFGWRMVLLWAVGFMAVYSGLMFNVPFTRSGDVEIPFAAPNTNVKVVGELTKENNLSRRIDEWLLIRYAKDSGGKILLKDNRPVVRWNHAYGAYPDNEGALSTFPAIAEVLLGILAGVWLRTFRPAPERGMGLLVFGLVALLTGMALDRFLMPINKNIWTPSFTVFTSGLALLCLGTCFFLVDVLSHRGWSIPFKIYGMNAIAAFVLSGLLYRLGAFITVHRGSRTLSLWSFYRESVSKGTSVALDRLQDVFHPTSFAINAQENVSLIFALSFVAIVLLFMAVLYVCKIFVKV